MTDAQIKRDLYKTYMITEDLQRNFENMPASEWNLRIVILLEQGHGLFMLHHNPFALILEKEYNNPVDAQMVVASVLMPGPQGVMFAKKLQDGYEQRLTKDLDTGNGALSVKMLESFCLNESSFSLSQGFHGVYPTTSSPVFPNYRSKKRCFVSAQK